MLGQVLVCVSDPVDSTGGIERAIQRTTIGMFDGATGFFEDQCTAYIVRVGTEVFLNVQYAENDGADVSDEAIVSA